MKKYTGNYTIRWTDKSGKPNKKVYNNYSTVIKAKKWLLENNASDIDIAVELVDQSPHFPVKKVNQ